MRRVLILGAAGRDFHDFNVLFRDDPTARVVGFTAAQIPGIAGRRYPPLLAGARYPEGIDIFPEEELEARVKALAVDEVVLSYSDLSHLSVMHLASRALAAGASFRLVAPRQTMLEAKVPVLALTASRTGAGKSPSARYAVKVLRARKRRPVVVRHPMPYGELASQRVQRFGSLEDLDHARVTLEEREDYEHHVAEGTIVFAGVDYALVLARAQEEGDVIVWDGGNNDAPFFAPDLWVCVVDPHRAGHELAYHPGEVNFRSAGVILVNKANTAPPQALDRVQESVLVANPKATVVVAASLVRTDAPELIRGKRVLLVEDGPTLTHGGMAYGAGWVAATEHGAREVVDPRPHAVGRVRETFHAHPHLSRALPAVGYSSEQLEDLEETIRRTPCDTVVVATPVDLTRVLRVDRPMTRVRYELADLSRPTLADVLEKFAPAG